MPHSCCVVNCKNRSNREKIGFYRIPSVLHFQHKDTVNRLSSERQQKWLDAIKRKDFTLSQIKNARVCAKHFITGKPAELQDKLNPDWVPSVDMGYDTTFSEGRLERHERWRKRLKGIPKKSQIKQFHDDENALTNVSFNSLKIEEEEAVSPPETPLFSINKYKIQNPYPPMQYPKISPKRRQSYELCECGALGKAVCKLEGTSKDVQEEDEFDTFGRHVAHQLRQLPLHRAIYIQQDFQDILTRARIEFLYMKADTFEEDSSTSKTWTIPASPLPAVSPSASYYESSETSRDD